MGGAVIGYEQNMRRRKLTGFTPTLLVTAALALGLTACGSDYSDTHDTGPTATEDSGTTGKTGEVTPGKKAPDSAKDKGKNAPDDAISDRPGGPDKPASP